MRAFTCDQLAPIAVNAPFSFKHIDASIEAGNTEDSRLPPHRFDPSKRQYLSSHVKQHRRKQRFRLPGTFMPELVLTDPIVPECAKPTAPRVRPSKHAAPALQGAGGGGRD